MRPVVNCPEDFDTHRSSSILTIASISAVDILLWQKEWKIKSNSVDRLVCISSKCIFNDSKRRETIDRALSQSISVHSLPIRRLGVALPVTWPNGQMKASRCISFYKFLSV